MNSSTPPDENDLPKPESPLPDNTPGRARLLPSLSETGGSAGASPYQNGSTPLPPKAGSPGGSPYPAPPRQNRRKPAQGVHIYSGQPTIVFVNVCTKDRARWLACDEAHRLLPDVWREADAWLVGNYVLMPDHLHLFAAPRDLLFTIEQWVTYWKSQFGKSHDHEDWAWQTGSFHHRLRRDESYSQKWLYAQENPVRAGLAAEIGQWPYQGKIHDLRW